MAKVQYKMQNILDIKIRLENNAKQDYAKTNQILQNEINILEKLKQKKEAYMCDGISLRMDRIDIRKIRENKMAVMKLDDAIKQQQNQVNLAAKAVEKARIALQEIMMERKTHEKMKEHAIEQLKKEELSKESKEIDQLTTYLYGQKIMGEEIDGRK